VDNSQGTLPVKSEASHYYAARATDAWTLKSGSENEKLLFYRGIGDFDVDVTAVVKEDEVTVRNTGADTIPLVMMFENRAGAIGYRVIRGLRGPVDLPFSDLTGTLDGLRSDLEDELTEMGLYRKEAHAMVETWRDSWFEEGLRVFYLLPRSKVDAVLPISVQPAPEQLTRVFVGRMELLAPWMKQEIGGALASGDVAVLQKYGRFLNAFLFEMGRAGEDLSLIISEPARQFLRNSYNHTRADAQKPACVE
jgi:hypothetical protein